MSYKDFFYKEVRSTLVKEGDIKNIHAAPKPVKIVVNIGVGEAVSNKNILEKISEELKIITGQKPAITKARKSISAFKIRQGMPIGVKVTLRGARMYDFLEKLIKIVLPRIRDFRGVSDSKFDGRGNLNLGLAEQILFPEIDYDKIDRVRGLEITIVTNTGNNNRAKDMLKALGMPFVEH